MAHQNGNDGQQRVHAATKLRRLLTSSDDIIVAPGVYDGFSARVALKVGFECIYMVRAPQASFTPSL